jgi:hypothetical protein
MTVDDVKKRLKALEANRGDPESAHSDEDDLHQDVLRAISLGQCQTDPPEDVAAEALKSLDIPFSRWYA